MPNTGGNHEAMRLTFYCWAAASECVVTCVAFLWPIFLLWIAAATIVAVIDVLQLPWDYMAPLILQQPVSPLILQPIALVLQIACCYCCKCATTPLRLCGSSASQTTCCYSESATWCCVLADLTIEVKWVFDISKESVAMKLPIVQHVEKLFNSPSSLMKQGFRL